MSDERSILLMLEQIEFFQGLARDEIAEFLDAGQWAKARPGEYIVWAGEIDLNMFVLIEGRLEVVLNRKVVATLQAGDAFGEFGLMGERRTANIVARSECLYLCFSADRLNSLSVELQVTFLKRMIMALMVRLKKVNRQTYLHLPHTWR